MTDDTNQDSQQAHEQAQQAHEQAQQLMTEVLDELVQAKKTITSLDVKLICRERRPDLPFFQADVGSKVRDYMSGVKSYASHTIEDDGAHPYGFYFQYRPVEEEKFERRRVAPLPPEADTWS
jgi:hypothetical protein